MGKKIKQLCRRWRESPWGAFLLLHGSSGVSVLFAGYNGVLGVLHRSVWNGSICAYYILLAAVRILNVSCRKKENAEKLEPKQKKRVFRITHGILLVMNLSMIAPMAVMVLGKRPYHLGTIPSITMAAYTTYRISISVVHFTRSRKGGDTLDRTLRTINLADALMAVLTLQSTLITVNQTEPEGDMVLLSAVSSAVIFLLIFLLFLFSWRAGTKEDFDP